jgi:hypothetical protein
MKSLVLIGEILVGWLLVTNAVAETANEQSKTTIIPLKKIWAWDMPGTTDVRSLEPQFFGAPIRTEAQLKQAEHSLISQSLRPLASDARQKAGEAFAVAGTGIEALENAHAVLAENREPRKSFSTKDELSVVFFSRISGTYIHIDKVQQQGQRIEIRYKFVPHIDGHLTVNFAIIPIRTQSEGDVIVDIATLPLEKKFIDLGVAPISKESEARIVCKSFRFVVKDAHGGE